MMFLFDDEHGQSKLKDLPSWGIAEKYAEDMGWVLIGVFENYVDEETGEVITIQ